MDLIEGGWGEVDYTTEKGIVSLIWQTNNKYVSAQNFCVCWNKEMISLDGNRTSMFVQIDNFSYIIGLWKFGWQKMNTFFKFAWTFKINQSHQWHYNVKKFQLSVFYFSGNEFHPVNK